jgi:hypothetical protein
MCVVDRPTPRPWFALHWLTVLLTAIVLCDIAWAQDYSDTIWAEDSLSFHFGWPFLHSTTHSALVAAAFGRPWDGLALVANVVVWIVLVLSVVSMIEGWRQPSGCWFRISVRQLLGVIAAIAVMLAWRRLQTPLLTLSLSDLGSVELNTGFRSWPWLAQLPLLFGCGCAVYTAGVLAFRLVASARRRITRQM